MKYFAIVLSFHILSTVFKPAFEFANRKLDLSPCQKTCSDQSSSENNSGCEKENCSLMTCCFKIVFMPHAYISSNAFAVEEILVNNFCYVTAFVDKRTCEIWNPPKV